MARDRRALTRIVPLTLSTSQHTIYLEPGRLRCLRLMTLSGQRQRHLATEGLHDG